MIKRTGSLALTIAALLLLISLSQGAYSILQDEDAGPAPVASEDGIDLYFSPDGHASRAIIHEILGAEERVRIQAYYFTSAPIAQALLDAKERGVEITVILDPSQRTAKYSSSRFFVNQGIPTYLAKGYAIYHHKVMLIDDDTIITGSMNFSRAGDERNAENTLIIRNKPDLFAAFLEQFKKDLEHAERLQP